MSTTTPIKPGGSPSGGGVYDDESTYDPQKTPQGDSTPFDRWDLPEAEEKGDQSGSLDTGGGSLDDRESKGNGNDGYYSGPEKESGAGVSKLRGRLSNFTRKKAATSAIIVVMGVTGVGGFAILQGPFQLIHAAKTLLRPGADHEQKSEVRLGHIIRFARSGEFGETRVGLAGSSLARNSNERLKAAGFEVTERTSAGRTTKIKYDLRKWAPGVTADSFAKQLEAQGTPKNAIKKSGTKRNPIIEVTSPDGQGKPLGRQVDKALHKDAISKVHGEGTWGKVNVAVKLRATLKWNGSYRNLQVISLAKVKAYEKAADWDKARRAAKVERNARTTARLADLKSKYGPNARPVAALALGQTALCIIKDGAHQASLASYENVQMPLRNEVIELVSVGSQIQSNRDLNIEAVGEIAKGLENSDGQSIWAARSMNALSNNGRGQGIEAEDTIKAGFADDNLGKTVEEAINAIGGEWVCSTAGQLIGVTAGLAAVVLAAPSGGATVAVYAGFTAASAAASIIAISAITQLIGNLVDGEAINQEISGAFGGNGLAYAARDMFGGEVPRADGGVPLPGTENKVLTTSAQQQLDAEYQRKGLATKILDPYNERSVVSGLIDKSSTNPETNLRNMANFTLNAPAKIFSSLSMTAPKAAAAENAIPEYDWGFPLYGFTDEEINNPLVEDPYENAREALRLLNENENLKERALDCFGIEFGQDESNRWYAKPVNNPDGDPEKAVVPSTNRYSDANCGDKSDEWLRIRMFIFDSRTAEAQACFLATKEEEEINKMCADAGYEEAGTSSGVNEASAESLGGGNPNLTQTIKIDTPGKFITLPSRYSCPGRTTQIDSRIAPALTYILDTYEMCADDGLANGHRSHGAGLGVDVRPRDQAKDDSREEWARTSEKFLRDINWWGDGANDPKSNKGCAVYTGYGRCVGGAVGPSGTIPQWVRWLGYNGDVDHGDPWHIYGGSYAHIHIGWDTPNNDGAAPGIIPTPRRSVYTFPAPIADDLRPLLEGTGSGGTSP